MLSPASRSSPIPPPQKHVPWESNSSPTPPLSPCLHHNHGISHLRHFHRDPTSQRIMFLCWKHKHVRFRLTYVTHHWRCECVWMNVLAVTVALWGTAFWNYDACFSLMLKECELFHRFRHMTSNRRRQSRWNRLILALLFSFSLKRDCMCESIIFFYQNGFHRCLSQLQCGRQSREIKSRASTA